MGEPEAHTYGRGLSAACGVSWQSCTPRTWRCSSQLQGGNIKIKDQLYTLEITRLTKTLVSWTRRLYSLVKRTEEKKKVVRNSTSLPKSPQNLTINHPKEKHQVLKCYFLSFKGTELKSTWKDNISGCSSVVWKDRSLSHRRHCERDKNLKFLLVCPMHQLGCVQAAPREELCPGKNRQLSATAKKNNLWKKPNETFVLST